MIYQVGEFDLLGRFLTALGVAGLAASLAAQDALKSYFGTLLLIGERAFKIGDRISVGGKEGVVVQVGFRSTRLRNSEDSLITVPNAVVAASSIDNMGSRSQRGFSSTLVMSPNVPLKRLLEFRDRLRGWVAEQPLVVRDKSEVHIHQMTDNGIEMSVNLSLLSDTAADEKHFREAIGCEILCLAESLEVEIAPASLSSLRETTAGDARQAA
jgi:MscS family membrane protein